MLCSSSQVSMDAGLYSTLASLVFSAISISILISLDIILTLVSVVFLNPLMDLIVLLNG